MRLRHLLPFLAAFLVPQIAFAGDGASPNGFGGNDGFSGGIGREGISPPRLRPSLWLPLTSSTTPLYGTATPTFTRADGADNRATVLGYCSTCNSADGLRLLKVNQNEARFWGARRISANSWSDYFADGSLIPTTTRLGYLSEGSRTNLILQSETFDNASWTKTRSTVTANADAGPALDSTADKLVEDTTATSTHAITQSLTKAASALPYTDSVYAKAGGRTRVRIFAEDSLGNGGYVGFDLSGGQVAYGPTGNGTPFTSMSASISGPIQGYYRCVFSFTTNTDTTLKIDYHLDNGSGTGAMSISYTGDGTSGVYLYGAQLEQASFASTYIPTTTGSVARAADSLTYPPDAFSDTAGTGYAEMTPEAIDGSTSQAGIGFNIDFLFGIRNATQVRAVDGTNTNSWASSFTANTMAKFATTWAGSSMTGYVNGASVGTGSYDGAWGFTNLNIGGQSSALVANGTIRNVQIFSKALTASQVATGIRSAP